MKISQQIVSPSVLLKANLVPINRPMLIISEYTQACFHCWNGSYVCCCIGDVHGTDFSFGVHNTDFYTDFFYQS